MLKQPEINFVCSGRQMRLKTRIGAERTRQRSFKPRSEFNFLFRDTAGLSDGFAWERNTKLLSLFFVVTIMRQELFFLQSEL